MPVKNTAYTLQYVAWDNSSNTGKTGDGANHTLRYVADGVEGTPAAPNITEVDPTNLPGVYKATLAADENIGDFMLLGGVSSTANVVIIPVQWANDDATISSRASQTSVDALPTATDVRIEMDTSSTKLANLDTTVSSRASQTSVDVLQTSVDAIKVVVDTLQAIATNKKEFVNESGVTYLVIYDTDGITPLYKWPYKDSTGADITLDDIGKLAKQLASVI